MSLTPEARRAERLATLSSCGVTGEATLTDSAVILIYAALLGAGDALQLLSTAVLPLLNGFLILPMALWTPARGCRGLVLKANAFALSGYLLTAASACLPGRAAVWAMLAGILLFSVCQTGFVAGWFPLLDTFLLPERRTLFLGRMRFCHQLSAVAFLALIGVLLGKTPGRTLLQLTLLAGAILFAGRIIFIAKMPQFPEQDRPASTGLHGVQMAIGNRALTIFSLYSFLVNVAMFAVVPVMLLCLRNFGKLPENRLVLVSAAAIAGMPLGYLAAPWMEAHGGRRAALTWMHLILLVDLALLIALPVQGTGWVIGIAALLAICNACVAANSVVAGAAMMTLAFPGNKKIAMAYWGAFYYGGSGVARLGASWLAGTDVMSKRWMCAGMSFSQYHTLLMMAMTAAVGAAMLLPWQNAGLPSAGPAIPGPAFGRDRAPRF